MIRKKIKSIKKIENINYKEFFFKDSNNKIFITISSLAIVIQLMFFKYWYPFASFINGDSYTYIVSAFYNDNVSIYPIGYSKFLRLFSVFTHSDTLLVIFQYLLLQISTLYFIFTLFYFFSPSFFAKWLLLLCILFNPASLYLANYISSDSIFLSLSLIWFTLLLWIIYKPCIKLIITNVIILFILFTIRYNALYYPIVYLTCLLYRDKILSKLFGLILSVVLLWLFISFNNKKYFELTGANQFSAFAGWQLANNALYAYRYVENKEINEMPKKYTKLNKIVRDYFDSTRNNARHPEEKVMASTVYMWTESAPLRLYLKSIFKDNSKNENEFKSWATIAPLYQEFGEYIIKKYPKYFIKYYLLPNILKFWTPPVEFLQNYSTGVSHVEQPAIIWFGYKSEKIHTIFRDFKVNVLNFYPIFVAILNVLFIFSLISILGLNGFKNDKYFGKAIIFVSSFYILNFSFSVFASPIALRFQLFPIIIMFGFTVIIVDFIIKRSL